MADILRGSEVAIVVDVAEGGISRLEVPRGSVSVSVSVVWYKGMPRTALAACVGMIMLGSTTLALFGLKRGIISASGRFFTVTSLCKLWSHSCSTSLTEPQSLSL